MHYNLDGSDFRPGFRDILDCDCVQDSALVVKTMIEFWLQHEHGMRTLGRMFTERFNGLNSHCTSGLPADIIFTFHVIHRSFFRSWLKVFQLLCYGAGQLYSSFNRSTTNLQLDRPDTMALLGQCFPFLLGPCECNSCALSWGMAARSCERFLNGKREFDRHVFLHNSGRWWFILPVGPRISNWIADFVVLWGKL